MPESVPFCCSETCRSVGVRIFRLFSCLLTANKEETKNICKFEGEESKDFRIWLARTEAALEAKDVLSAVPTHMVDAEDLTSVSQADRILIGKSKAKIIQGLGNKPLRLILPVKDNHFKMW